MRKITSFEIQAELYCKIKKILFNTDFEIRGEFKFKNCRFDLAVFDKKNKKIICIIEVKSYRRLRKPNLNSKQILKYSRVCNNIFVCGRQENIPKILCDLKKILF